MSKYAYSLELKRQISAKEAYELSLHDKLNDKRAFRCINQYCEVPLTCVNWRNPDTDRLYFKVSSNDKQHTDDCEYHMDGTSDIYVKIEDKIMNGGIITIAIPKQEEVDKQIKIKKTSYEEQNKTNNLRVNSIQRLYDLYKITNIPHDKICIRIDGKMCSFNDIFNCVSENIKLNQLQVFYGEAKLFKDKGDDDRLYIGFRNYNDGYISLSKQDFICSNQEAVLKKYFDSTEYITVYFMGKCIPKAGNIPQKFKPNYFEKFNKMKDGTSCIFIENSK